LAVAGNELRITIPEKWLGEAVFPVIVDPTIGTATVGSQYMWEPDPGEFSQLLFECTIALNRFLVSEELNGLCNAFIYAEADMEGYGEEGGRPVVFTEINSNPYSRASTQENFINFKVNGQNPKGWRSGSFICGGSVPSGSNIWFGVAAECFWFPRFDYGSRTVLSDWEPYGNLPATFTKLNYDENLKLSMYFTYTSAQNYFRTLTQGVQITDTRKSKADYKKTLKQTAGVNSLLVRFEDFFRNCVMTVHNTVNVGRFPSFFRNVTETVKAATANFENRNLSRNCADTVSTNSQTSRIHDVIRNVLDIVSGTENGSFTVLLLRSVSDTATVSQKNSHSGAFVRGLAVTAGSEAETRHTAEYHRFHSDTVRAAGAVFRGLLLFVRIVSKVFFRDYLLGRFLKAREELTIKSRVAREIVLESKIN
jgi:hypothetical protein